jgi:hypothetical protein
VQVGMRRWAGRERESPKGSCKTFSPFSPFSDIESRFEVPNELLLPVGLKLANLDSVSNQSGWNWTGQEYTFSIPLEQQPGPRFLSDSFKDLCEHHSWSTGSSSDPFASDFV